MIWHSNEYNGGSGVEQGGNVNKLVNYLDKDHAQVYDSTGRTMDGQDLNEFVRDSKQSEMQRDLVLSPEEGVGENMSDEEMSLRARQTLNEYFSDKPEASYAYTIHRDTDKDHVQAAVHGNFDSIKMFSEQFDDMDKAMQKAGWEEREEQLLEEVEKEKREQATEQQEAHNDGLSQSINRGGA